jgi:hypothetical protein
MMNLPIWINSANQVGDRGWAMRSVFKKIIEILDGTPAVYGKQKRWRGQSVVELTLVSPLLIVLLMGLAEIGWFANNFLILLEVTRVGARMGTVQTGDTSPLEWNNQASREPHTGWNDFPPDINGRPPEHYRNCNEVRDPNNREVRGFYNLISCVMTQQMDPLVFDATNKKDDIVISAFSLMAVDPLAVRNNAQIFQNIGTSPYNLVKRSAVGGLNDLPQVLVVGRYPTNANECTAGIVNGNVVQQESERDPFDYFWDSQRDYQLPLGGDPNNPDDYRWAELEGYDALTAPPYRLSGVVQPAPALERQRGWVQTGNHFITETVDAATGRVACIGSEWSITEIQDLMNGMAFSLRTDQKDQRARLPTQGLVMVELFWQHELLLKNPVFNPVWTILGDRTTLSVWAAFPLPSTEPRISLLCTNATTPCQ